MADPNYARRTEKAKIRAKKEAEAMRQDWLSSVRAIRERLVAKLAEAPLEVKCFEELLLEEDPNLYTAYLFINNIPSNRKSKWYDECSAAKLTLFEGIRKRRIRNQTYFVSREN